MELDDAAYLGMRESQFKATPWFKHPTASYGGEGQRQGWLLLAARLCGSIGEYARVGLRDALQVSSALHL